ncbi:SUMF1/EgtB/PvdO family nonheme iron enzyme [Providencia zhijiangensis]|uniref:SUMF1/EgtB/PvdO family nonheme iron enzyme n=1 Tax=Providencia zhijiangensis TaxID=3053982 RepID=A0ABZ0N029_9GAMM|nr:SUMF1/EgtB/PvdO family nonheme iron enzyme [Providencia sp. D4759]WPA90884.1 SUMF1/EgtB/PvdO family nonheme iron enzyme [Providencia sp. D4759]
MKMLWCLSVPLLIGSLVGCDNTPTAEQQKQAQQLVNDTLNNMVFVEGGTFLMGDFGGKDGVSTLYYSPRKDNKFTHNVTLDSFSISKSKVSWGEYLLWIDLTNKPLPKSYIAIKEWTRYPPAKEFIKDNYLASVGWQDAKDYCQWIGQQSGLPVDLPTEAQWEYAARSQGQFLRYSTDNGQFGTFVDPSSEPYIVLNKRKPNPLGLYDMLGNGWDWTNDWYDENYYSVSPEKNPQGPQSGTTKVTRGSAGTNFMDNQNIERYAMPPVLTEIMSTGRGFRCAIQSPTPISITENYNQ